ncbi:cellulase family glycosylhydrolase, partial [Ruminococcus champanellensis]|uniref:cellulase family glycosylhydrolase n=1 Tax=Ruminococcus champanellensis TaxID=1161942 RepID=UPI002E761B53
QSALPGIAVYRMKDGESLWDIGKRYYVSIETLMQTLNQYFLQKGHAVIIGEFGARNKYNTEDRCEWATAYTSAASKVGIPCIWWDNNAFNSGEAFGLYNRTAMKWEYPEIVDALMKGLENK